MAKKNQNTEVEKAAGTEVAFFIPDTESLGQLNEMQPEFSLTLKYKTADEWAKLQDKPVRAYYMGMKEIPNEDGEIVNCALFVSTTECFLSGQMTLIEAVKNTRGVKLVADNHFFPNSDVIIPKNYLNSF